MTNGWVNTRYTYTTKSKWHMWSGRRRDWMGSELGKRSRARKRNRGELVLCQEPATTDRFVDAHVWSEMFPLDEGTVGQGSTDKNKHKNFDGNGGGWGTGASWSDLYGRMHNQKGLARYKTVYKFQKETSENMEENSNIFPMAYDAACHKPGRGKWTWHRV